MTTHLKKLEYKHQCLRCGAFFSKNDTQIIKGCLNCGHRLFRLLVDKSMETSDTTNHIPQIDESNAQNRQVGLNGEVLDVSTIKIVEDGVYEINVDVLLKNQPLIVATKEGVYQIQLGIESKKLLKKKRQKQK